MPVERGDVVLGRFPHASGGRGKKRPVVVVQADAYNRRLRHAVVAQLAFCYLLTLMGEVRLEDWIGSLAAATMAEIDKCLKGASGIV